MKRGFTSRRDATKERCSDSDMLLCDVACKVARGKKEKEVGVVGRMCEPHCSKRSRNPRSLNKNTADVSSSASHL